MSEKTKVRSVEEIRRRGLEALAEALGPVDAASVLAELSTSGRAIIPRSALKC